MGKIRKSFQDTSSELKTKLTKEVNKEVIFGKQKFDKNHLNFPSLSARSDDLQLRST